MTPVLESLAHELDLELVVLFGSQAWEGRGRDTDLGLQPLDPTRCAGGFEAARTLVRRLGRADLDVVWLPTAPGCCSGKWPGGTGADRAPSPGSFSPRPKCARPG